MIHGDGRALRFVGLVAGGWIALRIAVLWQQGGSLAEAIHGVLPLPVVASAGTSTPTAGGRRVAFHGAPPVPVAVGADPRRPPAATTGWPAPNATRTQLALLAMARFGATGVDASIEPGIGTAPLPLAEPPSGQTAVVGPLSTKEPRSAARERLSVSGWMIVRSGIAGDDGGLLAPQLGGTQGGVRADYHIAHGFAATARVAAPAAGAGRELSLGVAWRPKAVPIRVVAEHRLALDGGRSGPAIGISGGVDALPLPAGFRLEGYGQAGTIFRGPTEHFVDASARATRVIGRVGRIEIDAGGGTWGAAQRGAARLDIGPSVGTRVPVADTRLRIAFDWRQRIAGNARPGSGPALTLGTDF